MEEQQLELNLHEELGQSKPEPFVVGSKARHIHSGDIVTIEGDSGGATIHVGFPGGRSQRLPRAVLMAIVPSAAKKETTEGVGKVPKKPKSAAAEGLSVFMREIQTPADLEKLVQVHTLNMNVDIAKFGMSKMRALSLIRGKLSRGEVTMKQLRNSL